VSNEVGMLIASGASEGVEETLESLLQPFLQQMSYDKSAENVFQNPKLLADAAYEGLIGTVLGLFGRGTSNAVDLVHNMIYDGIMPGEKLMADAGVSEPEDLGAVAIHQMGKMDDAVPFAQTNDTKTEYSQKQDEVKQLIQSDETLKSINIGHHNKHIKSSNGYTTGRSYIYGDIKEAQSLVEKYHGTGRAVLTRKGEWTNKEIVLAEDVIGVNVELETGAETETRRFTIHYGKKGTHIVPAKEIEG